MKSQSASYAGSSKRRPPARYQAAKFTRQNGGDPCAVISQPPRSNPTNNRVFSADAEVKAAAAARLGGGASWVAIRNADRREASAAAMGERCESAESSAVGLLDDSYCRRDGSRREQ
jgi:hypothetical protein